MKIRFLFLGVFCCVSLSSCDKAKDLAVKAKDAVEQQIETAAPKSEAKTGTVDPELQALVDEAPEGFRFRNDLPFPTQVNVTVTNEVKMKARRFSSSALGTEATALDGTTEHEMEIRLDGAKATVVEKDSLIVGPGVPGEDKPPEKKVARKGGSISMARTPNGWNPVSDGKALDFSMAAQVAGNGFEDVYLQRNGLVARPFWFGKGRLKVGDELTVEGVHLKMLGFKESSGTIRMKFEGTAPVHGHPCGIFSIAGSSVVAGSGVAGSGEGKEDYTIESGKLWLSLLYPIVLREEIDAVISMRAGKTKDNLQRMDGKASWVIDRKWRNAGGKP